MDGHYFFYDFFYFYQNVLLLFFLQNALLFIAEGERDGGAGLELRKGE